MNQPNNTSNYSFTTGKMAPDKTKMLSQESRIKIIEDSRKVNRFEVFKKEGMNLRGCVRRWRSGRRGGGSPGGTVPRRRGQPRTAAVAVPNRLRGTPASD